ncbi:hypothetical protein M569_14970 [Genlisea aurea]|uniref:mannose-6-phosphate isomerase n=1 Tax=Genlisea aurea TaxID=192259 RepID=S8DAZ3_9LAMI|nr:hypothetical protein M569_14970 [Genlisea aurea]
MGAEIPGIVKLKCSVMNYDWGKPRGESTVARLYSRNAAAEKVLDDGEDVPYAELWMGTHDSGPSYVVVDAFSGQKLKDWIERNPSSVGDKALKKWGSTLPFLFKVLSVAKALSLQAHPDKNLAEILHKRHPEVYKDDNHKPEMALAITDFEALCGFVDLQELKAVVLSVPEISEIIGNSLADQVLQLRREDEENKLKNILKSLFTELMSADKAKIFQAIQALTARLQSKREVEGLTEKEELVLRLEKQYPGDVGVLAGFLFNHVKLRPGEALYLGANEPHAYVHGECVECMATSDNVVRAGLTPKYRDVETLCSMLTYKQGRPEILRGLAWNEYTTKYAPPFDEFEVDRCSIPGEKTTVFPAVSGPSVFVVTGGEGRMRTAWCEVCVGEGDALFAAAHVEITVEATTNSGLEMYRAGINGRFLEKL